MERTSHDKETGLSSANPYSEVLGNHDHGSNSRSPTSNPTSRKDKILTRTGLEAEDALNGETGAHLCDVSPTTVMTSPSTEQRSLEMANLDNLEVAHNKSPQRQCTTASPCVPPSRQRAWKSQTKSRKKVIIEKSCSSVYKPIQSASRNESAVSSEPVKVKLWEPRNMMRERKHLNELDICLSVYDQVMQDVSDEEHRPMIKEVLLQHMKMTRKSFLVTIREAHMLQLIQKRHQMEKTRQKKLRRSMESTFKGLRKGSMQLLMKREFLERTKRLQLDDLDQARDDDLFKQLKFLLAPFDTQGMLVAESQSEGSQ